MSIHINRAQISINGESEKYQENNTEIYLEKRDTLPYSEVIVKIRVSKIASCWDDMVFGCWIDNKEQGDIVDFKIDNDEIQYNGPAEIIRVGKTKIVGFAGDPPITLFNTPCDLSVYKIIMLKLIDATKLSRKLSKQIWPPPAPPEDKKIPNKINYRDIAIKTLWITIPLIIVLNIILIVLNIIRLHLLTGG